MCRTRALAPVEVGWVGTGAIKSILLMTIHQLTRDEPTEG